MGNGGKNTLAALRPGASSMKKLSERLYLCILAVCLAVRFLDTTLFEVSLPWWGRRVLTGALLAVGLARFWAGSGWRDKTWLLCGVLVCCLAAPYWTCGDSFLPELALLLFAAVHIPCKKLLRVYAACNGTLLFITVLGALAGSVRDLVYYWHDMFRHSFGICFPTDFAAHVVYLLLAAWVLCEKIPPWVFAAAAVCAAAFVYRFCSARNSAIVLLALACGILFTGFAPKIRQKADPRKPPRPAAV